ncbi:MAG: hypothetical protein K8T91_07370 [Planctomycetes bacterium]|nr:hypothetical protein [Planctomycetota bacterium]
MHFNKLSAVIVALIVLFVRSNHVTADEESPRLQPYRKNVDRAVDTALLFLARAQAENPAGDGSFADVHGQTNAVAALSGMAFLSKGYRPGAAPYGDSINRSIDYILATDTKNGYLGVRGGKMYEHSIATLFLSEVSGMVDPARQQRIDVVLPRALKIILEAQAFPKAEAADSGGWRYEPDSKDSDMSVTGWCLMALRSARLNGAPVPNKAIDDALSYVDRCRDPDGKVRYAAKGDWWYGRRGYWVRTPRTVQLSAAALLCRKLSGRNETDINNTLSTNILKSLHPNDFFTQEASGGHVEYAAYYASQAMFQMGGEPWEQFAETMYRYLLSKQQINGAWFLEGKGEAYPTAMFTLALTVSYRQLPIYQR